MIASHDSYTYLHSTLKLYNQVTGPWKCQNKSIQEQYASGVRYFDIRIKREVKANRTMWRPCHGLVELNQLFTSIKNICAYFETLEGAYYRIILEKGDEDDVIIFKNEVKDLEKTYPHLDWVVIKDGWQTLLTNKFGIIDYCCHLNTAKEILDFATYGFSIKKWSDANSPTITPEMIADKEKVYFFEFV